MPSKTAVVVFNSDSGSFGNKHSGFVYLEDCISHTQKSPYLESQVISSNFKAMLPSRTEHKLTCEYGTSSHGFCHCNTEVTWQNNRIGQWPFVVVVVRYVRRKPKILGLRQWGCARLLHAYLRAVPLWRVGGTFVCLQAAVGQGGKREVGLATLHGARCGRWRTPPPRSSAPHRGRHKDCPARRAPT